MWLPPGAMAASRDESVVSEDMHSRLSSVLGKLASATDEEVGEDAAGVVASVTTNVCRLYRPASRDDFARRLCSFRNAAQWFGKPVAVGPVACARRGWRNVAVDLLECEVSSPHTMHRCFVPCVRLSLTLS